jgi:SAM-dependent methyltransferase
MAFVGRGDFTQVGQALVEYFVSQGGLQPHWSVLDVGCGIGRVAVPLTKHLLPSARYEGFDIVPDGIAWCAHNITPRYPNFTFQLVDVYNGRYNPTGELTAGELRFPYEAGTFDFVCLTSVFTHMLPDDVDHYVSEIGRVLKPGGRCVATFRLLNDESLAGVGTGRRGLDLDHDFGTYRVRKADTPEGVVAHREDCVIDMFQRHGLAVRHIDYGKWARPYKSPTYAMYQDAVIAELDG